MGQEEYQELSSFLRRFSRRFKLLQGIEGICLTAICAVLLFGAGIGNTTSLPPLIAQVEFAKEDVQRVVPLIVAIGQGTYAFAPAAFGALRALSPAEATLVFAAAAIVQALAIAAFLAGRPRNRSELRPRVKTQ